MSCIALFDIAAAFPSVVQHFIFLVLQARGFPVGCLGVAKGLYFIAYCLWQSGEAFVFLYWILSGVLQGCPLSGMLFTTTIDPIAISFSKSDKKNESVTGLCAGDVGSALPLPGALLPILRAFKVFEPISGLAPSRTGMPGSLNSPLSWAMPSWQDVANTLGYGWDQRLERFSRTRCSTSGCCALRKCQWLAPRTSSLPLPITHTVLLSHRTYARSCFLKSGSSTKKMASSPCSSKIHINPMTCTCLFSCRALDCEAWYHFGLLTWRLLEGQPAKHYRGRVALTCFENQSLCMAASTFHEKDAIFLADGTRLLSVLISASLKELMPGGPSLDLSLMKPFVTEVCPDPAPSPLFFLGFPLSS